MSFFIDRLTIIGVGLIGGSLARALKQNNRVGLVTGVNRSRQSLQTALDLGVIDHGTTDPQAGVRDADLVLVATPVLTIAPMIVAIGPALKPGAVVTDVGSVKGAMVADCERGLPTGVHFVGSHPIAGREHAGVAASQVDLFQGKRTILTPTANTHNAALQQVRDLWQAVGAEVETMDPYFHDRVLAATSHLPHLVAFNMVRTLSDLETHTRSQVFHYTAGGFLDSTRIASSDPTMWRDICLANREAILEMLVRLRGNLEVLSDQVEQGNGDALYGIFSQAKKTRDRILQEEGLA